MSTPMSGPGFPVPPATSAGFGTPPVEVGEIDPSVTSATKIQWSRILPPTPPASEEAPPVEVAKIDPDPFPGYENAGTFKDADFPRHSPSSEGYPLTEGHVRTPSESENTNSVGDLMASYIGRSRAATHGLKDSGHRVQTDTGAVRERLPGKGRYDLISPVVEERLAIHMEAGALKYGDGRNWEKGLPLSWYVDATKRHLGQFLRGEPDEDHLAAVLWNVHCLLHTEEMIRRGAPGHTPELNDLPGTRGAYDTAPPETEPEVVPMSTLGDPETSFVRGYTIPPVRRYAHGTGRMCVQTSTIRNAWTVESPGRFPDDRVPVGAPCQLHHPTEGRA